LGEAKAKMYSDAFGTEVFSESVFCEQTDPYVVVIDGEDGGVAVIKEMAVNHYSLELFAIAPQHNGQGVGVQVWQKIEALYPNAERFETTTPTFAIKNVNFYVNKCKFHIVELIDEAKNAVATGEPNPFADAEDFRYNFRFQKRMSANEKD
jgi:hypothetical protein